MPIVDFAQDPSAPYGTGNFRDDKGRVMYLHDPETAQQFAKTMPGAQLPAQVAAESDALASKQMGDPGATLGSQVAVESDAIARQRFGGQAPSRGPDQRLAQNAGEEGPPTLAQFEQGRTRALMDAADAAGPPEDVPETPEQATARQLAAPGAGAPAGSQPATAAAAAQPGAGAALVGQLDEFRPPESPQAVGEFAALPPPGAAPGPSAASSGSAMQAILDYMKLGQGQGKTQSVTTTTTQRGRPDEVVDAELARSAGAAGVTNQAIRTNAEGIDARQASAVGAERQGVLDANQSDMEARNRAIKAQKDAQRQVLDLQRAYQENERTLDPDRFVRNMSTGKRIGMTILAALNGAFGALIGQKSNGVLDVLNAEIERDIDRQKNAIAGNRSLLGNQIAEFMRQGHDAKTAEDLARDRMRMNIISLAKLERERTGASGQAAGAADQAIAQLEEQRTQQKNAALRTKENAVQEVEQKTDATAQGGLDQMLKLIQLQNGLTDLQDAETVSKIVGTNLSPDRVKELKAAVRETGSSVTESSGAIEMTKNLVEQLGGRLDTETGVLVLPGDIDPRTGQPVPGELRGVGPLDSRPSGRLLGVPVVGPFAAAGSKVARSVGLLRTDYDKAKDAQRALKERVTSMLTGANSNLRQDQTFENMVGQDFENEDQTRENLRAWVSTIFAQRNGQLARLGPEGQRYYFHNLDAASSGAAAPGGQAPPLRPHVAGAPADTPAPAAAPTGSQAPAGGTTELPKAPGPSTMTGFRRGTYQRLRESTQNERP